MYIYIYIYTYVYLYTGAQKMHRIGRDNSPMAVIGKHLFVEAAAAERKRGKRGKKGKNLIIVMKMEEKIGNVIKTLCFSYTFDFFLHFHYNYKVFSFFSSFSSFPLCRGGLNEQYQWTARPNIH
jgi:hypothetical protein